MKKLVLIGMVVAAVACGKTDDDGDPKCDSFCNGALKSAQGTVITSCIQYDSDHFNGGTVSCNLSTCEVNTSQCTQVTYDAEGEPCSGSGQGSCEGGLACIELDPETGSICMVQCDVNNDECAAGSYCVELSGGVCIESAAHGDMCYGVDTEGACEAASDICLPMLSLDIGACTTECDPTTVNTTSTCGASEMCLSTALWITEPVSCNAPEDCGTGYTCEDLSQYGYGRVCYSETNGFEGITCSADTEATDCSTAEGYQCVEFVAGPRCAVNYTICATSVPFWDGTTDDEGYIPESYYCGFGAALCGVTGATGTPAEGMCAPVFGDDYPFGVCVGFCEDDAGTELDCGTGFDCVQPSADDEYAIYWNTQEDAEGNPVSCTEDTVATDCDAEYQACKNFGDGLSCARPMKVCQPTAG